MRKFVALLFVVGAGYFIYTHPELYKPLAESGKTAMKQAAASVGLSPTQAGAVKEPFAWKTVTRHDYNEPFITAVQIIDGNRWRVEGKKQGTSKIVVVVCDGTTVVASDPLAPAASFDPRVKIKKIMALAAKCASMSADMSSQVTEQFDGHTCWKCSVDFDGMSARFWMDSITRFPVCLDGTINGKHAEVHYLPLQVDFSQRSAEFFGTAHTEPLFANDLTPQPNFSSTTQSAALQQTPGAGSGLSQGQKVLLEAVQIQVPYGTAVIPKGTSVQIVRDMGSTVTVRTSTNQEFTVRRDQIQ
ncbi:MAG: hypothetical protein WCD79_23220 [Chthoniobacteraceae bacterium]